MHKLLLELSASLGRQLASVSKRQADLVQLVHYLYNEVGFHGDYSGALVNPPFQFDYPRTDTLTMVCKTAEGARNIANTLQHQANMLAEERSFQLDPLGDETITAWFFASQTNEYGLYPDFCIIDYDSLERMMASKIARAVLKF